MSFGKTQFSSPDDEPEVKTAGLSKLVSFSRAGMISAQEALVTQRQMDILGKFGWELSGIVGSIGGDQQMVFRRIFDPGQSERESKLIRQEGDLLLAAQKERDARLAAATKSSVELVDLDEVEKAAATRETRQKEEERLIAAINTLKDVHIVETVVKSSASTPTGSSVTADIIVDGTASLLKDANKYRGSEALALAKQIGAQVVAAASLKSRFGTPEAGYYLGNVKVQVSIKATYQGTSKIVATQKVGGNW